MRIWTLRCVKSDFKRLIQTNKLGFKYQWLNPNKHLRRAFRKRKNGRLRENSLGQSRRWTRAFGTVADANRNTSRTYSLNVLFFNNPIGSGPRGRMFYRIQGHFSPSLSLSYTFLPIGWCAVVSWLLLLMEPNKSIIKPNVNKSLRDCRRCKL